MTWRTCVQIDGLFSEANKETVSILLRRRRPDFENNLRRIERLAMTDPTFRTAVDADIETIIERRHKNGRPPSNAAVFRDCSRSYTHEELAAFALMPPAVAVYPGSNLASVAYFLTRRVPGLDLLSAVHRMRIDFERPNATAPAHNPSRQSPHDDPPARAPKLRIA